MSGLKRPDVGLRKGAGARPSRTHPRHAQSVQGFENLEKNAKDDEED
jgi:hypothetical protein